MRGAAAVGVISVLSFFFSFFSVLLYLSTLKSQLSFHLSAGTQGSGGGAPLSSLLARRQRGYKVLSYSK